MARGKAKVAEAKEPLTRSSTKRAHHNRMLGLRQTKGCHQSKTTQLDSTLPLTSDKETTQGAAGTGEGREGPLHKNLPRLAEYKDQMDNRLATELENRKAEIEAVAKAAKVQESILEKSTTDQYLRYQRYWTAFCVEHKYGTHNVAEHAATRFFMGLIAEEEDPEKGIFPLLVRKKSGTKGQVNRRRKMIGLRDRLDICWLQFMMSRGENLRKATLPDIFAHEVMRQLFPFIEGQYPGDDDWKAWIENIMLDRDIYHGRSINAHESSQVNDSNSLEYVEKDDDDVPRRRHLILLAHLREVIMDLDDPTCKYDDHFIFALPIFKSALFRQFRDQLRQQMDSATSPLVDSLSANAPAIHQEF
ncbi:MAG: hypothetical protein J3Q66DRAFT_444688 [Benniella sp.]|nr:MAG: hypothetical protein J3Q66DRAFT_444688 [Benniella sp.]